MERMKKPKFIKEIEKSEGKERAKCGRWYIGVYGELDHKPMVELESLEIIVKELHKLEEENKKLNIKVASLEGEIKGLNYTIEKLKEENQTLELWLDNKEKVNKSLREENKKLKNTINITIGIAYDKDDFDAIEYLVHERDGSEYFTLKDIKDGKTKGERNHKNQRWSKKNL